MRVDISPARISSQLFFSLNQLGYKYTLRYLVRHAFSVNHYYIMHLNLSFLKDTPYARLNYQLDTAGESDFESLIDLLPRHSLDTKKEIIARVFFRQAGFRHCYLARTPKREIAYLQWLITPDENDIIVERFPYRFYPLRPKQVMLENAFAFPRFRGLGLLPRISAELLTRAKDLGYKHAIVYIKKNQIASLNEFLNLGFKIRKLVREHKILGFTKRML